jgi:hypothetical protein
MFHASFKFDSSCIFIHFIANIPFVKHDRSCPASSHTSLAAITCRPTDTTDMMMKSICGGHIHRVGYKKKKQRYIRPWQVVSSTNADVFVSYDDHCNINI